ncbi:DUF1203 domain-containing protein [Undibacterium sp. Jales W-56]|uniref:DUF1203 domain-containing protein n=1 Tax=Undibacterium sp. Jales W-56 TaxID=2897325 RepID=UPI0021CF8B7F|nr:DUF1203 domain-containing protein [Undibacterium sp. Jales W-56]MCU6435712.1 DUF1203 domain-containing protein [Undibacterium sp. Jales W-56]
MSFRILGLSPTLFQHLYGLPESELAVAGVQRCMADSKPGFPDRVTLCDAEPGQHLLLLNYVHQDSDTPYRASHAIFVLEGATDCYQQIDAVPESLRSRMMSLRAFDAGGMMLDAGLVHGRELETEIARQFADPAVTYLQAHYATRGCYAARIERV